MQCPSRQKLDEFILDAESVLQATPELGEHFETCARCRHVLDGLAKLQDRHLISNLLTGHLPPHLSTLGNDDDGYRLEECLGSGNVYRAHRIADGQPVAIKLYERLNAKQACRVSLELQIAATVSHPNIVTMLDSGVQESMQYAVFEWIGSNLAQQMVTGVLPIRNAAAWVIEVALAVQHLHELGFVHRDLKPQNVLISSDGVAKLADFGVAKDLVGYEGAVTTQAVALGTPGYMAPEQTGLVGEAISVQTDIYGLGALLFSLLVGQPPYKGETREQTIRQVARGDLPSLRAMRRDLPLPLRIICEKCLRTRPADRYESAAAVAEDLRRFLANDPIAAKPKPLSMRIQRWSRRHARSLSLTAATLAAILAGVGLTVWESRRENMIRQHERLVAKLTELTSCEVDQLSIVYSVLHSFSNFEVEQSLDEIDTAPLTLRQRGRLAVTIPSGFGQRLSLQEWIDALGQMPLPEVMAIGEQLQRHSLPHDWRQGLLEAVAKTNDASLVLNLCHLLSIEPKAANTALAVSRLLQALQTIESDDVAICEDAFRPWSGELTEAALLESKQTELSRPLLSLLVRWNRAETRQMVKLVQLHRPEELEWLKQLSAQEKRALRAALLEQATVRSDAAQAVPLSSNDKQQQRLAEIVKQNAGQLFHDFGYVTSLPRTEIDEFLATLDGHGWSISSIQSLASIEQAELHVALAIERVPGPCEIAWQVAIEELPSLCRERANKGSLPKTFWLNHDGEQAFVDVVFTASGLASADFVFEKLETFEQAMVGDSDALSTEAEQQLYSDDISQVRQELSLITRRTIAVRDERLRRVAASAGLLGPVAGSLNCQILRYVEQIGQGEAWVILSKKPFVEHQQLASILTARGYELRAIKVATKQSVVHSLWRRREATVSARSEAMPLMALWEVGEPTPLLEALRATDDPSLRTALVVTLAKHARFAPRIVEYLKNQVLDVDQVQQLVVALGSYNLTDAPAPLRREISSLLSSLQENPDSGVHFAARWAQRSLGLEAEVPPVIDPTRYSSAVDLDSIPHRGWFYSRSGIPFVVIRTREPILTGSQPDVTWRPYLNQAIVDIDHDFAISAIEIPNAIFSQFAAGQVQEGVRSRIEPIVPDEPITANTLVAYLRFCRWLSDQDGVGATNNCLPPIDEIDFGMEAFEDFFERDGYRLPSQTEWEVAARAGTWTTTYFGSDLGLSANFAWSALNTVLRPKRIGSKPPNPWGLHDTLGNVYEINFFRDRFPYPGNGPLKVTTDVSLRGGSFLANQRYSAFDELNAIMANSHDSNTGIRIVRTIPKLEE